MRYQSLRVRAGTLRSRRIALPVLTMLLFAVSVLHSPSLARGEFVSNTATVSAPFGDDTHTSTLNPYPLIPVSTITYDGHPELNGQCAWINAGLEAFKKAPGNSGWTWDWAGVAKEAAAEKGISLVEYKYDFKDGNGAQTYNGYNPFVVERPAVTSVPGSTEVTLGNPKGIASTAAGGPDEMGGAVLDLKYTPQPGVDIKNLFWIQAYTGTLWGHDVPPLLDNDPDNPYRAQRSDTPFYGGKPGPYAAGTLTGGGGWFIDTPTVPEFDSYWTKAEYESNPVASIQFQVVLADFDKDKKHITLYGGEWWGFTYTAVETPEPASCLLLAFGGGGLVFFRRMTRKMCAA